MKFLSIFLFLNSIFLRHNDIPAVTLLRYKSNAAFVRKIDHKSSFCSKPSDTTKVSESYKTSRNAIYFQALGNTPFIGMGYRFRVYEKLDYLVETGLGMGFTPFLGFESRKENTPIFSYSFHTNMVIKTGLKISPVVGLSGVLYGGIETSRRRFAFIPSPSIGLRLGNLNKASFNLMWNAYFYKVQYYEYPSTSTRIITRQFKLAYGPSANIQFSF